MLSGYDSSSTVARSIIGKALTRVQYLFPVDTVLPQDNAQAVHEVDHGVQITVSNGEIVTLMWQMDGECAALLAYEGTGFDAGITELVDAFDVSQYATWKELLGRQIARIEIAWHDSERGCPRTPWSFRFHLDNDSSFVVALAEIRAGKMDYMPDNICVIFSQSIADDFVTANSWSSDWVDSMS